MLTDWVRLVTWSCMRHADLTSYLVLGGIALAALSLLKVLALVGLVYAAIVCTCEVLG